MSSTIDPRRHVLWSGLARALGFLGFWFILYGTEFLMGTMVAVMAAWASLRLLPAGHLTFRPVALAKYALRFLRQSISAGIDAARRALDPRLPLSPGFVVYKTRLPSGPLRNAFCTATSLLPGALPCGTDQGGIVIHCLDVSQVVGEQLAAEEALLVQALGGEHGNG